MDALRHRARLLRNGATDAERHLWQHLRARQMEGFRFRRQVPIAGYIADFVCPQAKVIVELDGGQHSEQGDYDAVRTAALESHGFRVLRYWNHDVLDRTEAVLDEILRELTKGFSDPFTPPQPSPALGEREGAQSWPPPFRQAQGRVGEGLLSPICDQSILHDEGPVQHVHQMTTQTPE